MPLPIQGFRVGSVKAAIWANTSPNGTHYNVTFQRSYQSDGQWKNSTSFGPDDLESLASVAETAHYWIIQKQMHDKQSV